MNPMTRLTSSLLIEALQKALQVQIDGKQANSATAESQKTRSNKFKSVSRKAINIRKVGAR